MRFSRLAVIASAATAIAITVTATAADRRASATSAAAVAKCPTKLRPLGSNPVAAASRAALAAERSGDRSRVTGAAIATTRFDRSQQVVRACGTRIAARSVVVTIHRRAYDSGPNRSASLSQATVVVARFSSGWRVWNVLH